jgi:hypothetical protein
MQRESVISSVSELALLRFWFVMQFSAHGQRIVWVDGAIAFFDMLNHTVLVDHNIGALRPLIGLILFVIAFENAVGRQHFLVHVA